MQRRGRPRLLYVLNSFANGGAEWGLPTLVEAGAFAGCELKIAAIVRGGGVQLPALSALGADVEVLRPRASMRPADLVNAIGALRRLLRDWQPDALILSLPQANILGRLLAWGLPQVLVLSFEHNSRLARWPYELGFRVTSPRVDWLLADSERTASEAERRLYLRPAARRTILPLLSFERPPMPTAPVWKPAAARPFHIVTAGRLTWVKNHRVLVEAVDRLGKAGRPVHLTIYGEGEERLALERLRARLRLESSVSLPGHVRDWQARPGADLFVLSSRHEGLSVASVEAMHAGVPVLATDVAGICDYAGPDDIRRLADARPDTIAAAVEALIADPAARSGMSRAGQAIAEQRFGAAAVRIALGAFNAELHRCIAEKRGDA